MEADAGDLQAAGRGEDVLGRHYVFCTPSVQNQWDHSKGHPTALLVSLSQAVKPLWELVGTHSSLHPKCFPRLQPAPQHQRLEFAYELLPWLPASQETPFPGISPHNARRSSVC